MAKTKKEPARHIDDVMGQPNRISNLIEEVRATVDERLKEGLTTKEQIEKSRKSLDFGMQEYCKFQEFKSVAMMQGWLTEAEAQTVYVLLGEAGPQKFNDLDMPTKYVLNLLFAQILEKIASLI